MKMFPGYIQVSYHPVQIIYDRKEQWSKWHCAEKSKGRSDIYFPLREFTRFWCLKTRFISRGKFRNWTLYMGRKPINHTSWVAVVTPTDRPKSDRNRCVIELFVALFVLSLCPFDISAGVGDFVIGLSQISSFSLYTVISRYAQFTMFFWYRWHRDVDDIVLISCQHRYLVIPRLHLRHSNVDDIVSLSCQHRYPVTGGLSYFVYIAHIVDIAMLTISCRYRVYIGTLS